MEFYIERARFRAALERAQGIVDRRNTIPVLANVLIQTKENSIKITASDTEIAFTGEYEANIIRPGETTIGARQLFEIVKSLPEDTVHVSTLENDWIEIVSGRAYFKIVGLSADGFPAIPTVDRASSFRMSSADLKDMIDHTFFSIATDDSRYGLNGAFLEQLPADEGGHIRMISTDGHRLSIIDKPLVGDPGLEDGVLLPRKGLAELRKLCDEFGGKEVEVVLGENSATFLHEQVVFFMRLLEGDFPDYRQVIPARFSRRVVAQRDQLNLALRRVALLSSEKTHSVRFHLHDDVLEISASNPDLGESRESMEAVVEGDSLAIGFNARYCLDVLSVLKGERVAIELGESLNPGIIREEGRADVMFVVMPMRLE